MNRSGRVYRRKQRAWRLWCEWATAYLAARYPKTGGIELYVHNWYRCSPDPLVSVPAEEAINAVWARWRRIDARYKRLYDQAWARENPNHLLVQNGTIS